MKSALITGAGSGIGAVLAARAAQSGYKVGVLDIDEAKARAVASKLEGAVALAADVTDEASVERAVAAFGAVPDLLVNNAAITFFGSLIDQGIAGFRKVVDVNLMGTFIPAWIIGRQMVARGSGVIVNLTSINAITPRPEYRRVSDDEGGGRQADRADGIGVGTRGREGQQRGAGLHRRRNVGAVLRRSRDPQASRQSRADGAARCRRGHRGRGAVPRVDEASYINGHQLVVDGGVVHSLLAQLPLPTANT